MSCSGIRELYFQLHGGSMCSTSSLKLYHGTDVAERVHYKVTVEVSREDLSDGRRRTKTRTYRVDADEMTEERIKPCTPPGIYAWQHDPHRRKYTTHLLHFWRNNALVFTVDASTVVGVDRVAAMEAAP
jgi:hypothetical protein